jgi:rubredoxin
MLPAWNESPIKKCPECGAVYEVFINRSPEIVQRLYDCAVCGWRFDEWQGTIWPSYKLVWAPEEPAA